MGGPTLPPPSPLARGWRTSLWRSITAPCECIGLHAARRGDRFETLEPLQQGVREHFGRFEENAACSLTIRHEHGSNNLSNDFQRELKFLGMVSSPSFVREPERNGCVSGSSAPSKENQLWVRAFVTISGLGEALREFKRTYNGR